jgi:hypothetical protein
LQQGPWEDFCFRNVVPGRGAAAVPVKFRPGLAGVWPGEGGGVFYGPLGFGLGAQLEDRGCRRGCSAAPPCGVRLELAPASSQPGQQGGGAARL